MSGLGGFCPLPLRLGGGDEDGWSVEAHARMAADLVAAKAASDFAVVVATVGSGVASVTNYLGRNGEGVANGPTTTYHGVGDFSLSWPVTLLDVYEVESAVRLVSPDASAHGSSARRVTCTLTAANVVRIRIFDWASAAADGTVTLTIGNSPERPGSASLAINVLARPDGVSALAPQADIGDYGGEDEKEPTRTEVVPYAARFYRDFRGARGSAYAKKSTGFVHAENLALARSEAARWRAAEKLGANSTPRTSDERLERWVEILGVHVPPGERRRKTRQRCSARYKASVGPTLPVQDAAAKELLGPCFVKMWRQNGSVLSAPPTQTFWPGVNPGPTGYALVKDAGGNPLTWLSERAHLVVEVTQPAGMPASDFLYLMNVQLFDLLDRMLPSWETFNWAMNVATGFQLDVSKLDFGAIT